MRGQDPTLRGGCFGLFMGAPPLGDSPLVAGQSVGWGPHGGGQPPQMVESVGRKVGPHGGTPWTREHVFSMFGGNMFSLFGGCMFCGLNFSPPSPLPPLYKEVERHSPSPTPTISHKPCMIWHSLSLPRNSFVVPKGCLGSGGN